MLKGWNNAPKASLTIRMLIGAYLLYIDYQIFGDVMAREGASKIVMITFMVFFAIVGVFLIIMSLKALTGAGSDKSDEKRSDPADPEKNQRQKNQSGMESDDDFLSN